VSNVASQTRAILFLGIAAFAAAATTRVMDSILPQIAQGFDVTVGTVAFVVTAYAFAYGAFQLVFGPLGDRFGKYKVITLACIGAAATTYACALAGSIEGLAMARFASGIMAASIVPLSIAWIGDVVPPADQQHILARFMSTQILGLMIGQIGGGVLGEFFGWRSTFLLIGSVYLFAVAGMGFEMIRNPATRNAIDSENASFWRTWNTFLGLTSRPVVRFVLLMVMIEAFAMFGALTYVGASLRLRFNLDFASVGLYLATYCIGGLFFVTQSRRLIRFFGSPRLAFWGTVLVAIAYSTIALTPVAWVYLPALAVMGSGFYMLHNTLQTMATQMAPDARGSAVGIFATSYFLSQAVGIYLAGQVIDLHGTAPIFLTAAFMLLGLGVLVRRYMPAELRAGR